MSDDGDVSKDVYEEYDSKFRAYIGDDLNTANAITLIYDLLKDSVNDSTKLSLIKAWDTVLSLDLLEDESIEVNLDSEILEKIELRNKAKLEKNYELADKIRDELLKDGIKLIDGRDGTTYEFITK